MPFGLYKADGVAPSIIRAMTQARRKEQRRRRFLFRPDLLRWELSTGRLSHPLCVQPACHPNLEHPAGIGPAHRGFADLPLSTWVRMQTWSTWGESNSRMTVLQTVALPLGDRCELGSARGIQTLDLLLERQAALVTCPVRHRRCSYSRGCQPVPLAACHPFPGQRYSLQTLPPEGHGRRCTSRRSPR